MGGVAARRTVKLFAPGEYRAMKAAREGLRGVAARSIALRLLACLSAMSLPACSLSFPLASMLPEDPVTTGSIGPVSPLAPELDVEDWRRARAALAVALDPQGNGARASWDNPETKRAGAFSPSTRPFVQDDRVCRGFVAELSLGAGEEREISGAACRHSEGIWRIDKIDDGAAAKI
jgi:surface antigen